MNDIYIFKAPLSYEARAPWDQGFGSSDEIKLRKFGSYEQEDEFVCSLSQPCSPIELKQGDLVMAKLEFGSHKNIDGIPYQEIRVTEIKKIG